MLFGHSLSHRQCTSLGMIDCPLSPQAQSESLEANRYRGAFGITQF